MARAAAVSGESASGAAWMAGLPVLLLLLAGCSSGSDDRDIRALAERFEGGTRTVAVGEPVTFRIVKASHTVDFSEGDEALVGVSKAHSGNLVEGERYDVTFTEPGSYPFFCRYHSSVTPQGRVGMVGTITVTQA